MKRKRWMGAGGLREELIDRLACGVSSENPAVAKEACFEVWKVLCLERIRVRGRKSTENEYAHLDRLGKMKFFLLREDWCGVCSALMDLLYFYPITRTRSNIVHALAPYFTREGEHRYAPVSSERN